jgi:hypothetical protein
MPPPGTVVDVWYVNTTIGGVDYSALDATGMSDWDLSMGIKRALAVWNEQSGASIKLRYRGATSSTSINGAILIFGEQIVEPNGPANCDTANGSHSVAETVYVENGNTWVSSRIIFHRYSGYWNTVCHDNLNKFVNVPPPNSTIEVVGVLVHELGHAAFNIGHPNGTSDGGQDPVDCAAVSADSVMLVDADPRNLGNWDLEVSQDRYGSRNGTLYKSHMLTANTWKTPNVGQIGTRPSALFRMGSLTDAVNLRALAWTQGSSRLPPRTSRRVVCLN